ncbi:MAG TPA: hypothetical protein VN256_22970 [Pyrinomonadaceae bacterium]|nr:hypothetical protein [Pyrinomonadaceae bacterium]
MSYLDVPRLHFAGSFIAKPSTVNNIPTNYDPATPGTTGLVLSWNPNGNHDWEFLDCTVRTAVTGDGTIWNAERSEPIIGAGVQSRSRPPFNAKLVDLDTEQQMVSQIWGLRINVAVSATEYVVGNFRPMSFDDIWARVPDGQQDWMFSAYYQSVLEDLTWGDNATSPFLRELCKASPDKLSIKFVVDAYQDLYYMKDFNRGRIVGTIGPAYDDEPPNFLKGRQLRPFGQNSPLNYGYAKVDKSRRKLVVDLGNSVPTQSDHSTKPPSQSETSPPIDVGTLIVAVVPAKGDPDELGKYDYSLETYLAAAGVQEYFLTDAQLSALADTPIGVIQTRPPKGTKKAAGTLLQESPSGAYINCTQPFLRMNPGESCSVELFAFQFGEPAAKQSIALGFNNSALQGQEPAIPPAPAYWAVGVPASALTFPQSVVTDSRGRATFDLAASDPGNPRQVIDGQVYGVGFSWALDNLPNFPPDSNNFVSVLVFDSFKKEPTWENLQPFLMQYAVLYPFMDSIFILSDPEVYRQNMKAFKRVISLPITDPGHMPVTRDMSRDKRQALLAWLNKGAPLS